MVNLIEVGLALAFLCYIIYLEVKIISAIQLEIFTGGQLLQKLKSGNDKNVDIVIIVHILGKLTFAVKLARILRKQREADIAYSIINDIIKTYGYNNENYNLEEIKEHPYND